MSCTSLMFGTPKINTVTIELCHNEIVGIGMFKYLIQIDKITLTTLEGNRQENTNISNKESINKIKLNLMEDKLHRKMKIYIQIHIFFNACWLDWAIQI